MFLRKIKSDSSSGYSLIELAVVIAIISVMSVLFLTNFSQSKKKAALDKSAQQMVMDLRRVQNMAMATTKFNGLVPMGGYGINVGAMPTSSYTVFADMNNSKQYEAGEAVFTGTLDSGVQVTAAGFQDLVFVPPDPQVCVDGKSSVSALYCPGGLGAPATVTVTLTYSGLPSKVLTINTVTGQITAN